jgi:hypothetical protein
LMFEERGGVAIREKGRCERGRERERIGMMRGEYSEGLQRVPLTIALNATECLTTLPPTR